MYAIQAHIIPYFTKHNNIAPPWTVFYSSIYLLRDEVSADSTKRHVFGKTALDNIFSMSPFSVLTQCMHAHLVVEIYRASSWAPTSTSSSKASKTTHDIMHTCVLRHPPFPSSHLLRRRSLSYQLLDLIFHLLLHRLHAGSRERLGTNSAAKHAK